MSSECNLGWEGDRFLILHGKNLHMAQSRYLTKYKVIIPLVIVGILRFEDSI
ncbi:hypothetical protein [Floridanema evergladense]|uniref:Uncharacterized protein n=1 Tax=Floridaenema evergladense BLCC-F167 TaxID=3153639 RepID=A0ABV4WEQ5_9CYAN